MVNRLSERYVSNLYHVALHVSVLHVSAQVVECLSPLGLLSVELCSTQSDECHVRTQVVECLSPLGLLSVELCSTQSDECRVRTQVVECLSLHTVEFRTV